LIGAFSDAENGWKVLHLPVDPFSASENSRKPRRFARAGGAK
jgi:hypothetical protein